MSTTETGWEVIDKESGVLTRSYPFAKQATARMMTVRLKDGSLAAISPAAKIDGSAMLELEKWGGVSALIAPNGFHHLGLPDWLRAFPKARVFAPKSAHVRLRKRRPEVPAFEPLESLAELLPPNVRVHDVPGNKLGETWLTVDAAAGPIWYVSDSCFSMKDPPPHWLPRLLFRWTNSAPGFRINGLGLKFFVNDRPAYRQYFLNLLAQQLPAIVVTAHGEVVKAPGTGAELKRMVEARL
jgi:hypothetical protein